MEQTTHIDHVITQCNHEIIKQEFFKHEIYTSCLRCNTKNINPETYERVGKANPFLDVNGQIYTTDFYKKIK